MRGVSGRVRLLLVTSMVPSVNSVKKASIVSRSPARFAGPDDRRPQFCILTLPAILEQRDVNVPVGYRTCDLKMPTVLESKRFHFRYDCRDAAGDLLGSFIKQRIERHKVRVGCRPVPPEHSDSHDPGYDDHHPQQKNDRRVLRWTKKPQPDRDD